MVHAALCKLSEEACEDDEDGDDYCNEDDPAGIDIAELSVACAAALLEEQDSSDGIPLTTELIDLIFKSLSLQHQQTAAQAAQQLNQAFLRAVGAVGQPAMEAYHRAVRRLMSGEYSDGSTEAGFNANHPLDWSRPCKLFNQKSGGLGINAHQMRSFLQMMSGMGGMDIGAIEDKISSMAPPPPPQVGGGYFTFRSCISVYIVSSCARNLTRVLMCFTGRHRTHVAQPLHASPMWMTLPNTQLQCRLNQLPRACQSGFGKHGAMCQK